MSLTETFNQHPWVVESQLSHANALICLSEQGIAVYRTQGREAVIENLKKCVKNPPHFWRFVSENVQEQEIAKGGQPCRSAIWQAIEADENTALWRGMVPLDLDYFAGHFAHFPLVPGVVELQWVMEKITLFFAQEKAVQRIDNLKFQKFLRPCDEFVLHLQWEASKNRMRFQLKTEGEACASGLIVFSDE